MRGIPDPNSIVLESIERNPEHSLSEAEQVNTFDQGGGGYSIASIKFAARESPWQKALLGGDVGNAHRIIRAAMNLAEPSTADTKNEMAKQFFRQLRFLVAKSESESEKKNIYHVATALEIDPELKKARQEVEQSETFSESEPKTEPASAVSTPRPDTEYLTVDLSVSKYSPFVNEVFACMQDPLKIGSAMRMWNQIKDQKVLFDRAALQIANELDAIKRAMGGPVKGYRDAITSVGGKELWNAVREKLT